MSPSPSVIAPESDGPGQSTFARRARRACIRAEDPGDLALAKSKYGPSQKENPGVVSAPGQCDELGGFVRPVLSGQFSALDT
jgi:hypothetical protein